MSKKKTPLLASKGIKLKLQNNNERIDEIINKILY